MKRKSLFLTLAALILFLALPAATFTFSDIITGQSGNQQVENGQNAKFWVQVPLTSTVSRPNYQWFFSPKSIGDGEVYALLDGNGISGSSSSTLTVRGSSLTEGVYTCSVELELSLDGDIFSESISSESMRLTVTNSKPIEVQKPDATLPGRPNPRVIAGENSISVDWLQVDDGGSVILAYYCQINDNTPHIIFFTPYGANITYFRELTPGTDYTVKVWAENAVGAGPYETVRVTTYGKKPEVKQEVPKQEIPKKDDDKIVTDDKTVTEEKKNSFISLSIGKPSIIADGKAQAIDQQGTTPVIRDGRTLMPVRAIVEAMGGRVEWNEAEQAVVLKNNERQIKLVIGSRTAKLDGVEKNLDVAPVIIGGRTMLPIRFVAESFGYAVDWEQATETVTIRLQD